jgi:hypothetical protein
MNNCIHTDGRRLKRLHKRGQQVRFQGFNSPVWVSWFYLKRHDGKGEKRFVLPTRPLKASTINWWGKRRWHIEGYFKTAKHGFGLHGFGQATLLGVDRWLLLSLISFVLAHWAYLSTNPQDLPDWGQGAQTALEFIFPQILMSSFLLYIKQMIPLAGSFKFDIIISRCKI